MLNMGGKKTDGRSKREGRISKCIILQRAQNSACNAALPLQKIEAFWGIQDKRKSDGGCQMLDEG